MNNRLAQVLSLLSQLRCDLTDEKRAQQNIADALLNAGWAHEREHRLSDQDIVDFMVNDGIAVEVKLKKNRKRSVWKQLCRYAEHDAVQVLVLVSNLSIGLPETINDGIVQDGR